MKQKKTSAWLIICTIICAMALFGMAGCGANIRLADRNRAASSYSPISVSA